MINEAREELCAQQEPVEDEGPQVLGEATTAMKDVVEMCVKVDDSLSFEERVSMLNADQRRVFDGVSDYLNHLKLHEAKQCSCNQEPVAKVRRWRRRYREILSSLKPIKMLVAQKVAYQ